ncbi:DNA translocase FtsK, partial [Mesorhizobium sp. B1-1-9]
MRSGASAPLAMADTGHGIQAFARRQVGRLVGVGLFLTVAFGIASLATWNVADPSFSHATNNIVTNAMGYAGAVFSDLAMQFFGLAAVAALVPAVIWGYLLFSARGVDRLPKRGLYWFGFALLCAAIAGCIVPPKTWPLPTGLGGVFGDMVLKIPGVLIGGYPTGLIASVLAVLLAAPALWLFAYGAALTGRKNGFAVMEEPPAADPREDELLFDNDEDEGDEGILALGAITHWWLSLRAWMHRRAVRRQRERDEYEPEMEPRASAWRRAAERVESAEFAESRMSQDGRARVEPEFFAAMVNDRSVSVDPDDDDVFDRDDRDMDFDDEPVAQRRAAPTAKVQQFRSDAATRVEAPAPRPAPGARVQREAQTSMIGSDTFEMPSLHFLSEPKNVARDPSLSKDALEQNARLLEGVLEDFGVKGEIIAVRPGPVVTLYELEPAPGIKSSRVIGLSDDIARSMSAIACRVAVVPGRNAIGIELPNAKRETVYLREIMASRDFETTKAKLALALGKTINGEAVIVDIAKMPHVLVAGTTGSGKSVAINTMILSLLYRLTPQECRLIMIDP